MSYICVMDLINQKAQSYAEKYSPQEDKTLNEVEKAAMTHPEFHMLSGSLQGKFLEMISKLLRPMYILEIGSFLGYSALCLAKGLKPGGELHTIEIDETTAVIARANFKNSKTENKIILHTGKALEILGRLNKPWDLVFIDADKTGYGDYYKALVPKLKSGCLMMADNVLFHGQILDEEVKGKNAKAIQAFNEMVLSDDRVEKMMLTLRDGVYLIRKK